MYPGSLKLCFDSIGETLDKLPKNWNIDPTILVDVEHCMQIRVLNTQGSSSGTSENPQIDVEELLKFGEQKDWTCITGRYSNTFLHRMYDSRIHNNRKFETLQEDNLIDYCLVDKETGVYVLLIVARNNL